MSIMAGQPLDKQNIIRVRLSLFQNDDSMYGSVFCTFHSALCSLHFTQTCVFTQACKGKGGAEGLGCKTERNPQGRFS